ncbi:ferrous iron transport protein B [Candidatus Bathyarchaeota archaeon]|nr:ferrous iron transport protein B [Candidatus Bathyarchaeota archaeon]MBS7627798.1 ferrous iron transport protein B [Candidatus Bathyarchaeota archaeon]
MTKNRHLTVALAGNANVGKSVIFNQLTGLNQIVGNWPGKTVERAEGTLYFEGYTIRIIDLPGIYSLSAYSIEELVAREYIAIEKPDVIINVIDASALERNLYFTIQLLELEVPMVIALNQVDFAAKKGIRIDVERLSRSLGIPVIPTIAVTGSGLRELLSAVVKVAEGKEELKPLQVTYGKEVEGSVSKLQKIITDLLPDLRTKYPSRWLAVKLVERDPEILKLFQGSEEARKIAEMAEGLAREIEGIHGEPSMIVIASERYGIANRLSKEAQLFFAPPRLTIEERLATLTAHKFVGYPFLAGVMAATFSVIFLLGGILIERLEAFFDDFLIPFFMGFLIPMAPPWLSRILREGILSGIAAGVTIALPYVVPFYLILAILEDTGYLPRAAFLMDNLMHKIGLHGKAFIPLLLGYGCNVPACIGCRIMETHRERLLAGFVTVLIPCAARTVVILGLVGNFVGLHAALGLYAFDLILVFALGRIAFKALPGEAIGLIMEMPPYRVPSAKVVLRKTWFRTKEFVFVAFPLIIIGSLVLSAVVALGLADILMEAMGPIIVGWLGLPLIAGIPLIFGVLRKELTLILLAELAGTTNFAIVMTPRQMIVFSLVTMIYIPCIATIAALIREFGLKRALAISLVDITLALFFGGLANALLQAFSIA